MSPAHRLAPTDRSIHGPASRLVKPDTQGLVHLQVLRTERLSPHWMRVTLGGGEIDRFRPMGYDQWFRLFLPLGGDEGLDRLPAKANKMFGYLKYLRIPDGVRPVMRNYTVRAFRPATADGGRRDRRRLRAARLRRRRHGRPGVALGGVLRAPARAS